jgi:hypothetical protein
MVAVRNKGMMATADMQSRHLIQSGDAIALAAATNVPTKRTSAANETARIWIGFVISCGSIGAWPRAPSSEQRQEFIFRQCRAAYLAQQEERSHRAVHGDDQVRLAGLFRG